MQALNAALLLQTRTEGLPYEACVGKYHDSTREDASLASKMVPHTWNKTKMNSTLYTNLACLYTPNRLLIGLDYEVPSANACKCDVIPR